MFPVSWVLKCDLAFVGQDLVIDEVTDLQHALIVVSSEIAFPKDVIERGLIILSKCIILIMSEEVSANNMLELGKIVLNEKHVGVLYELKRNGSYEAENIMRRSWPFPIILERENGKLKTSF